MPPREVKPEDYTLIKEMYATFQASGVSAPASFSDFQRGFTAIITMFEVKRRPLPYNPFPEERRES